MNDPSEREADGDSRSRDKQMYQEDRAKRLHRGRLLGYAFSIALWLLSAVPLVRLSSDEGGGTGVAAAYLAAGLGVALVIRGIYKLLRGRPFWSPWLFVIAAVLAIASYAIQSAGERVAIESKAVLVSTS
ncbi:MAG: hypothetical protein M3364_05985 [Actinomycetota bacterium]|nr:hypothetical protein [Actinomycetota bacterium]